MADLRRIHLTISKGMKLYCTVEEALEDVVVVSLKHKTKEYRGILLDSSERHLPPGLCFSSESGTVKTEGENASNSGADGADQLQPKEVKGVTLDTRYSYNNDPAKYNEQPLPTTSAISIRPARGKQVRNIRLRPRQTLCSKCKAVIHDTKSKSPSKSSKPEGESQEQEAHPHNTRYRAALSGKPSDAPKAPDGPTLRSGARNRRADSTPKVLLENIRPKREVKPTAKKKDADAAQKSKISDSLSKKSNVPEEQTVDGACNSDGLKSETNKRFDFFNAGRKEEDTSRVMLERSVSLDNSTALSQYNKQPVVRLDKSAVNNVNIRTESKEEKQEKAPTISIVNIRSTPAIKISYGGAGDRDVVKIPPRLPGAELKSPEGHSTADESPVPLSPPPPPAMPLKKAKKASKRTRDKQRYRVINDVDNSNPESANPGIKIAGHHKRHKRKHKHRHASSEDENFNAEIAAPPPAKLPAIITKLSVVPPVNDMNGNEKKGDSDVLKDSSNETPTQQEESLEGGGRMSPDGVGEAANPTRKDDIGTSYSFDNDPLGLKVDEFNSHDDKISDSSKSPTCIINKEMNVVEQSKTESSESSPAVVETKPYGMWARDIRSNIARPAFETDSSPGRIVTLPFQVDDSQDELSMKIVDNTSPFVRSADTPQPVQEEHESQKESESEDMEETKESVPYGVGVFEDLTPDEDEDEHDDHNVSQPAYQLPLAKKPRMIFGGWHGENLSSSSQVSGYLSKKSAAVMSDTSSSVYSGRPRVFQNGPNSYFSPSPGPSSMYSSNPSAAFPSSPAPRILNSPTPIIQKSPVPIFNYNSSRYQGSPNRRFGSSPNRRFHSIPESISSRHQSVIEGNLRQSSQSSLSRYQGHENEHQFQTPKESHSSSSSAYCNQSESDLPHSNSGNRYPAKFDSRSTIRYQSSSEKTAGSRYTAQSDASSRSNPRLSSAEDSNPGSKSYRPDESSASTLRYVSSSGDSSVPRFTIPTPSDVSSSASQFLGPPSNTSAMPRYPEGSLPSQYRSLGSTDSRYQTHNDTRYSLSSNASIPSSPSPLSLQTSGQNVSNILPGSLYHGEKDRKSSVMPGPCYETVDTSALFMTHSHAHIPVSSGDSSVQGYLNNPSTVVSPSPSSQHPSAREQSTDPVKSKPNSHPFCGTVSQNAPVQFHRQDAKFVSGSAQGSSVLFPSQGQSGSSSITCHPSSASLSQSHLGVSLSDSEEESDNAVPGFAPSSGVNSSVHLQDVPQMPMMKIQTQNMSHCVTEDGREIRVGDVQWGKVQGFPWWPCRVVSIKLTHRDHREQKLIVTQVCHVSWFGSSTVSDLHPSELRPFREEFIKRHVKKKRGPYQVAVQQAMMATGLALQALDASHVHNQQPLGHSLMHDLVS